MSTLARWCFHHRKLVLTLWLIALVGFIGADMAAKADYSTSSSSTPTRPER